jgi:hypothetical protein
MILLLKNFTTVLEFGLVKLCISVGYFTIKGDIRNFRVTSFFGERKKSFLTLIIYSTITSINRNMFCADTTPKSLIFLLARRMIINNIAIPDKLNLFENHGKFRI